MSAEGSELYLDDIDYDDGGGGGNYLRPGDEGWKHFVIEDVDDPVGDVAEMKEGDKGAYRTSKRIKLTLRTLAPEKDKDKLITLYLNRTGGFAKRTVRMAFMFGLLTRELVEQHKEAGTNPIIPWSAIVGMNFCAEVEKAQYEKDGEKKDTVEIKWNFMTAKEALEKKHPVDEGEIDDPFSETTPVGTSAAPASDPNDPFA